MSVKSISLDCVIISVFVSFTSVAETNPMEIINDTNKIIQNIPLKFMTLIILPLNFFYFENDYELISMINYLIIKKMKKIVRIYLILTFFI